jgi:hypothetical protein
MVKEYSTPQLLEYGCLEALVLSGNANNASDPATGMFNSSTQSSAA